MAKGPESYCGGRLWVKHDARATGATPWPSLRSAVPQLALCAVAHPHRDNPDGRGDFHARWRALVRFGNERPRRAIGREQVDAAGDELGHVVSMLQHYPRVEALRV